MPQVFTRNSIQTPPTPKIRLGNQAAMKGDSRLIPPSLSKLERRRVEDSDTEAESNPIERAFFACRKRKWNADNGHDKRHQRKGQFSIEVDHQRADVEPAPF